MLPIHFRLEGELERELDYLLSDIATAAANADRLDVVRSIEEFTVSLPYAKLPYAVHACVMARTLNALLTDEQRKEIHEDVFTLPLSTFMHLSEFISRTVSIIGAYGKENRNYVGHLAYLEGMLDFVYNCKQLNIIDAELVNYGMLSNLSASLSSEIDRVKSLIEEKEA